MEYHKKKTRYMNKFDLQFLACATNCCEVYMCVCVVNFGAQFSES